MEIKQVFISVGMSGRLESEVMSDIRRAWNEVHDIFDKYWTVKVYHNFNCAPPSDELKVERLYYLGEAIKKLGECDACYFTKGWQSYRGCKAEYEICKLYGIEIIEEA